MPTATSSSRKSRLANLSDTSFDLIVVGAGIYGAAAAWDAALRGLSVALVDKGDFGSGTSFNNLKTVHGGIRYLQHLDFRRMRESIRERRTLLRIAPHLVHPLPFLVPTYRGALKQSRFAMGLALWVNDLVSWDRNRVEDPQKHLAPGKTLSREECLRLVPGLASDSLTGGALWYDAQMANSDRVTLSFVLSAVRAGAVASSHVRAEGFLREGSRIQGVRVRDLLSDESFEISGHQVLNAAGPWVDTVLSSLDGKRSNPLFHFSKAMNLVTRQIVSDVALGVTSRRAHRDQDAVIQTGSRFLCVIPWRSYSLVGTSHAPFNGEPDSLEASERDIQDLLDDVNDAYPHAMLKRDDVRFVHRGILPRGGSDATRNNVTLAKTYRITDHASEGADGLISLVGVKYTTARDVAEKAVDVVVARRGDGPRPSRSASTPLYGGDIERFEEFVEHSIRTRPESLTEVGVRRMAINYGTALPEVWRLARENARWLEPIVRDLPDSVTGCELVHAVRSEFAEDLPSVVLRRTDLGSAGHPGAEALTTCARIVGSELGWSEEERQAQVDELERFYRQRS